MRIAYFDTIGGISGDMTLGAFVSAGVSIDALAGEIASLNLNGIELEARHIERNGITAVKVDVVLSPSSAEHRRHLEDIIETIDVSSLSQRVKSDATRMFREVARAEAHVHNTSIEKVHFHEVGALDSIVDIVGAAVCCEKLGIEAVYSSPVKLGSGGLIKSEHGILPLPAPATLEILKDYPCVLTDIPFELTTPTGAAIIKAMSSGVLSSERIRIESIGYGAGTREIPQVPNLLRVMIGELIQAYETDEMVMIETNIDDMNPEIYPYVLEKLLASGANDVYLVPIIMKKGRPGILLSVLSARTKMDSVLQVIFAQTSTIGVRIIATERRILHREQREVKTKLGTVRVKAIILDGKERLVPEYEECKRLAEAHKMPLVEVYKMIEKELPFQQD